MRPEPTVQHLVPEEQAFWASRSFETPEDKVVAFIDTLMTDPLYQKWVETDDKFDLHRAVSTSLEIAGLEIHAKDQSPICNPE